MVGPGAVGALFAARLSHAGNDVVVAARPRTARALGPGTLRVEGIGPIRASVEVRETGAPVGRVDGAILAVKAFDLAEAAGSLQGLGPIPVLLLQNGLGIEAAAAEGLRRAGAAEAAPCLVRAINSIPSTGLGPGVVRQAGEGSVIFDAEPPPESRPYVEWWAGLLERSGFAVRRVAPFGREVWRKLLVNASINPVTADHGIENGRLVEDPWRDQALELLEEARAVASAEGHEFTREEAEIELFRVARATASNRSSMLQDLDHGRRTEIDAISGALLEAGARHGLTLPATQRIFDRIRRRRAEGGEAPVGRKG